MALERLLASLERDATTQAEAMLADARARAAAATAAADERATRRKAETLEAREQAQRAQAELAVARARRAARARVLEARARFLARVFDAARARLPAAAVSAPFQAALPQRLRAARACLGDAPAALRCTPGLVVAIRRALNGDAALTLRGDPAVATGFVVATTDGAIEIDETLETRFARRQAEMALTVVQALDGTGA